jgi:hypothetical protein
MNSAVASPEPGRLASVTGWLQAAGDPGGGDAAFAI